MIMLAADVVTRRRVLHQAMLFTESLHAQAQEPTKQPDSVSGPAWCSQV